MTVLKICTHAALLMNSVRCSVSSTQQTSENYSLATHTSLTAIFYGPYDELYSMVQNKMAMAISGLEICALTTIPERADVGDGSGGKRGTSETLPKPLP